MWYWLWSQFNLIGTASPLGASFEETVICILFAWNPPLPFHRTHLLHLFGRRNKFLSSAPALQLLILPDLSAILIAKHRQDTQAKRAGWAQDTALPSSAQFSGGFFTQPRRHSSMMESSTPMLWAPLIPAMNCYSTLVCGCIAKVSHYKHVYSEFNFSWYLDSFLYYK